MNPTPLAAKAKLFSMYLGCNMHEMPYSKPRKLVIRVPHPHWRTEQISIKEALNCDANYLFLRSITDLTDEEKKLLLT